MNDTDFATAFNEGETPQTSSDEAAALIAAREKSQQQATGEFAQAFDEEPSSEKAADPKDQA
jgi:hypothetical protein